MASFERTTRHLAYGSVVAALLVLPVAAPHAVAQGGEEEEIAVLEEVTVVGTRQLGRSAADLPVPVDVIKSQDLLRQGNTRMDAMLARLIPSYNLNQQAGSDEATFVRPANMRGLPPDSTLVLVNGKRRHRSSVIAFLAAGGTARGAHGVDVSTIPAIALKRVEVLRDGASAQYGSDAIAGVINFVLKDKREGLTLDGRWGEFYKGDGDTFTLMGNWGLPVTGSGFVNLSMEYREADPTSRSVQRWDAQHLIDAGQPGVRTPAVVIEGAPRFHYDAKFFGNGGYDLGNGREVYAFGNYAQRKVEIGFNYRNPFTRNGVFKHPATGTLLVADLSDTGNAGCGPAPNTPFTDEGFDTGLYQEGVNYLDRLPAHCYSLTDKFPGGFTPQYGATLTDWSTVFGTRGELSAGWHYDVSAVFGQHTTEFYMENTVNPQLVYRGNAIPTFYEPGSYRETDRIFNVDLSRPFETDVLASPLNVALGMQYRTEEFEVGAGDENSWYIHRPECVEDENCTNLSEQGFGIGSNGFTGFHPDNTGTADRGSYGVYLDLEADVLDDLFSEVAVRYEDIEQFGDTLNGKIAARYQLTDRLAVRGSVNTGFRVPTVGQASIRKVVTTVSEGSLKDELTVPTDDPAARLKGARPLEPETSVNLTAGTVLDVAGFDVTIDYFNIELKDRIAQTSPSALTSEDKNVLESMGVRDAQALSSVKFYANAFTSKTQGIDVVAERHVEQFGGVTHFTFAGNWTVTRIDDIRQYEVTKCEGDDCQSVSTAAITPTRKRSLERNIPKLRFVLTANHLVGPWRFMGGLRYYGRFFEAHTNPNSAASAMLYPSDRWLVDAEVAYTFDNVAQMNNRLTFILGAQNLLNTYPSENPVASRTGSPYPLTSPFGFNGGFYYFRGIWEFDI